MAARISEVGLVIVSLAKSIRISGMAFIFVLIEDNDVASRRERAGLFCDIFTGWWRRQYPSISAATLGFN
jgi:hypothetical protein